MMKYFLILIFTTYNAFGQSLSMEHDEINGPKNVAFAIGRSIGAARIISKNPIYPPRLDLYEGLDNYYGFLRGGIKDNGTILQMGSPNQIQFLTSALDWSPKLTISSSGFLGVNELNPSVHLEVNGLTSFLNQSKF